MAPSRTNATSREKLVDFVVKIPKMKMLKKMTWRLETIEIAFPLLTHSTFNFQVENANGEFAHEMQFKSESPRKISTSSGHSHLYISSPCGKDNEGVKPRFYFNIAFALGQRIVPLARTGWLQMGVSEAPVENCWKDWRRLFWSSVEVWSWKHRRGRRYNTCWSLLELLY